MGKIIFQQDDCAPDAYETFREQFLQVVGISVEEFKSTSVRSESERGDEHYYTGEKYTLSICASDPYWTVTEN